MAIFKSLVIFFFFFGLFQQRGALGCATAMGGARWTKMAGTASASLGGGERAVTWPWKLSALTVRTMKEVRCTNSILNTGENTLRNRDFTVRWLNTAMRTIHAFY